MTKIPHFVEKGEQRGRAGKWVYVVGKVERELCVRTYMKRKLDVEEVGF